MARQKKKKRMEIRLNLSTVLIPEDMHLSTEVSSSFCGGLRVFSDEALLIHSETTGNPLFLDILRKGPYICNDVLSYFE